MLARLRRAYAALDKAPAEDTPLARLHPNLRDREHLTPGLSTAAGMEIESYVGHATIYREYVWVRKAIGAITAALSPLQQRVVDADGRPVAHELNALLSRPNDQMDAAELREIRTVHKLLGGEWFLEVVDDARGRPIELWPRRPDETWVIPDESRPGYPAAAGYQFLSIGRQATVTPESVITERFYNPLNDWRGISVIGAARHEIAVDLRTLANTLRNLTYGSIQYAVTTNETMAPQERARVEAEVAQKYGRERPIILEAGQGIARFGDAPDDLEWLAARDYSREGVGALFNVPDEVMGFGRDTYENFDTALKVFWLLCLLPIVQRDDATMTHFFSRTRPLLAPGQRIVTDLTGVSVLQESLGPKLEQGSSLFAMGVPYNTVERVLGLGTGPIPGGDVGYLPSSLIPASMAAEGGPVALAQQAGVSKAANARQKSRRQARALQRVRSDVAARMEPAVSRFFDDLAGRVVSRAEDASKAAAVTKDLPPLEQLLLPGDGLALGGIFRVFTLEVIRASWELWNQALDVELAFDESDPAVVAAMAQSGERITGIMDTTRDAVRALLQYGAEQGWSIDQLVRGDDERPGLRGLVEQAFRGRARLIARTELGEAQQTAAVARYQAAGVGQVLVLDNGFDDSHPECTRLDGTVQTLLWAQQNRLQHPGCLTGDAVVFAPNQRASFARWFDGEVIIIRTAANDLLTCTPNHPVLTPRGWVAASELQHGDHIVRSSNSQRICRLLDPNDDHMPATIEEVAHAPLVTGGVTARVMPASPEDFHGDGIGSDVYIERANRALTDSSDGARFQHRAQLDLERAIVDAAQLASARRLASLFQGGDASAGSGVGGGSDGLAFALGGAAVEKPQRFGLGSAQAERAQPAAHPSFRNPELSGDSGARLQVVAVQPSQYVDPGVFHRTPATSECVSPATKPIVEGGFGNTDSSGDLTNRLASLIALVEIIKIERRSFAGHVYNLETTQGWYIANNIITHNCVRAFAPHFDD